MVRDSTTAVVIFIILLVTLVTFLANAYGESIYYEEIHLKGYDIHLFVVNDIKDLPCDSKAGCAVYGYFDGVPINAVFLHEKYLHSKDVFGYSILYHELKHIFCQCDWHEGLRWV